MRIHRIAISLPAALALVACAEENLETCAEGDATLDVSVVGLFAGDTAPLDATVALQDEAGCVREGVAEGGFVTFSRLDPGQLYAVTADPDDDDLPMRSQLGVLPGSGLELQIQDPGMADMVTLQGAVANRHPNRNLLVTASARGSTFFQDKADAYAIEVPRGEPFTLLAVEWTGSDSGAGHEVMDQSFYKTTWRHLPGLSEATTLDLSLGETWSGLPGHEGDSAEPELQVAPPPVERASARYLRPADPGNSLGKFPRGYVMAHPGRYGGSAGWPTHQTRDDFGWDVDLRWSQPPDTNPFFIIQAYFGDAYSGTVRPDHPEQWGHGAALLTIPAFDDDDGVQALAEPFVFLAYEEADAVPIVALGAPGAWDWIVLGETGATEIALPELPSSEDGGWLHGSDAYAGLSRTPHAGPDSTAIIDKAPGFGMLGEAWEAGRHEYQESLGAPVMVTVD